MEGYNPKGSDTSEGLTPPNCSYITRCKELIKTEHANWIGLTNQDAIAGVLSELETYKKIAEKLAEVVDFDKMNFNCGMCVHDNCITECALEWARNEVENDKQS